MKKIDFTKPGKMPVTQDVLDYLQTANREMYTALISLGSDPATINSISLCMSGMVIVGSNISNGYIYYNGDIVPFTGGALPALTAGNEYAVLVTETVIPLTIPFFDTSTPDVMGDTVATMTTQVTGTAATTTQFAYAELVPFQKFFAVNGRESDWSTVAAATTGNVLYKKNYFSNAVIIRGSVNQPFGMNNVSELHQVATMGSAYAPTQKTWFIVGVDYSVFPPIVSGGGDYLRNLSGYVDVDGSIWLIWIKPDSVGYKINFNEFIPLD